MPNLSLYSTTHTKSETLMLNRLENESQIAKQVLCQLSYTPTVETMGFSLPVRRRRILVAFRDSSAIL